MYSRSAKGGEKGDPNRNPWLAKMGGNRSTRRKPPTAKKDTYHHSFFPRSIREWNQVPSSVVDAASLEDFKVRLNSIPWLSSQHR
jgi:hypothetical protein